MIDNMNEIVAFSPFGGQLIREEVKGKQFNANVPENTIALKDGEDRDMYVYVPASGCPDAKQAQVVMFLREDAGEESARQALEEYNLARLAEEKHFVLVFPNPRPEGWNYDASPEKPDDVSYFSRCFMSLAKGQGKVGGFLGMIFYLAATPEASAMAMTVSAMDPVHAAGVQVAGFPAGYTVPAAGCQAPQVAWVCGENPVAAQYLAAVNGPCTQTAAADAIAYTSQKNPAVRYVLSPAAFSARTVRTAWEQLFSETRRWANDTHGTYQLRTNFTERGFVAHVKDASLGVNNGFAHTWYEYVPPKLRGSTKKVPRLFYFHGVWCVPLYGAEQSCWHDIADKEDFIVVYPAPSLNKAWNVWDESSQPSDFAFVMSLIDHMKKLYPIDEQRIYISGFSMGGMMTNALASAFPHVFAAAAPCNGYHTGYMTSAGEMWGKLKKMSPAYKAPTTIVDQLPHTRMYADYHKNAYDYRMPIIQNTGLLDGQWPIDPAKDSQFSRLATFEYWKKYNNIPVKQYVPSDKYESGLEGDENGYLGDDGRFLYHAWHSADAGSPVLYKLVLAKRMPHAVDLRQLELAWAFLKKFSRQKDGSLKISE